MASDFLRKKAKEQAEKLEKEFGASAYGGTTWLDEQINGGTKWTDLQKKDTAKEIAPLMPNYKVGNKDKDSDDGSPERTWFKASELWDDGYQFGDVTKTILASGKDLAEDVTAGFLGIGEMAVDAFATAAPYIAQGQYYANGGGYIVDQNVTGAFNQQIDSAKKLSEDFVKKDLYDEEAVAKKLLSLSATQQALNSMGVDTEKTSIFGEKTDALAQSGGQLLGQLGVNAIAPGSGMALMGVTSFGSEAEAALGNGATLDEAAFSGVISAGAELLTEKIGGISFGWQTLTDRAFKNLSRRMTGTLANILIASGKITAGALVEGGEEILSGYMSALGQKMSYMKDKEVAELFTKEDALESFIGGVVLGGMGEVGGAVVDTVKGKDYVSGLTDNEKAVVDKIYKDEVAEAEKNGKVSEREKTKIYDEIIERMEKGQISTDTIGEVLGGDSYKAYKATLDSENALTEELKSLQEEQKALEEELKPISKKMWRDMTGEEQDRREEIKARLPEIQTKLDEIQTKLNDPNAKAQRNALKAQLDKDTYELTKKDRLRESYFEVVRANQKYTADVSQYTGRAKKVIQQVMDSGLADNSNQTHEFWDMMANMANTMGTDITLANDEQILEMVKADYEAEGLEFDASQFEGQRIDGYISKNGIVLNAKSKRALNFVVGHEITHSLEGTKHYAKLQELLFEYAKDEYESRFNERSGQYANKFKADEKYKSKVDKEVTGDLVGDYIFNDKGFIDHLAKDRNVFQRVWDEVKAMAKIATAGSEQARQLEKVKREFERAYREANKAQKNETDGGVKLSVSETTDGRFVAVVDNDILSKIDISRWDKDTKKKVKKAASKELKKFSDGFTINGIEFVGNKDARGEYTRSEYSETLARKNPTAYLDKMRASSILDDVIQVATDWKNDGELKHDRDDYVDFVRGNTLLMSGDRAYKAVVLAGITSDGRAIFHDLEDIYPDSFELKKSESSTTVSANESPNSILEDSDGENVAQKGTDVKGQFSFSDSDGKKLTKEQQEYSVSEAQNQKGLNREQEIAYSISNDSKYMDKAIAKNESNKGYAYHVDTSRLEEAKAIRERIATRMNEIKDNGLVGLPEDIEGNTYIANSSYDGTEENTTICPRSLASEAFVDAVSEYLGRPLTVEEQIYISQDLQGRSLTPECTYCYVATDRKAYRAFLGEYINQRNAVLEKLSDNPNADVSRSGELYREFLNGRKDTNPMYSRFKMWVESYKNGTPMVDASHLANINKLMGDINSEFGAELKPQIVDAMKYAQSASWAKKRVNYVAYNGHILNWKQDRINKLNSHYGLRMYSFSDFHPAFVLENMQMITDASVRGLKMLGYTKDIDFVDIFAPSGMNINVSTFGFEANGNVYENNLIGAEWEKARALREQYPNVGITFVATNDTLVNWALEQDWIDVVIPYHLVRTGAEVAKAFNYTNYTSESADTKTKEWTKGDKKYIAPTEHNNDKATYLAALEKNHLKPRFERFIDNPNYMKLVNECRQPASVSKPVQPVFNEDAAMTALAKLEANGYYQPIGGSVDRMYEIAAEVAEKMTAPVKTSISDIGQKHNNTGGYQYYSHIPDSDIAPVAENATTFENPVETVAENTQVDAEVPVATEEAEDIAPVKTTKEKLNEKLISRQTELEHLQKLRAETANYYDEKIAKEQALLDSKKNKQTKAAIRLKMRIERLQRLKADNDAKYAKRIQDITKSIDKTSVELEKDHTERDRYANAKARIERILESDKAALVEEYASRKAEMESKVSDKNAYISNMARELYDELRGLRKGVRASENLGSLLDAGYDWGNLRSALSNVRYNPSERVNMSSAEESAVRQLIEESYENDVYSIDDLDLELSEKIHELESEADTKKKNARRATQRNIKQGEYAKQMEELIGDTTTWVDKKFGIQYEVNTLRRNLRDIVRDANGKRDIAKADAIYEELQGKYNTNEALLNRESNQIKKPYADMKLTKAEDAYVQMLGEFRHNPDTTITQEMVDEFYQKNKGKIDTAKVDKAIEMARQTYDTLLERVNEVLKEQGMKEIPYRKGYFPHFTDDKQGFLGKLFNWKVKSNEIPTDIAGLTEQFNPNRSWQSFNKQRNSDTTDYSFSKGLDTYVQGALDWIYHIEDIQKRRAFENHIRYVHSEKGVQEKIDAIRANQEYDADEMQEQIDLVLKEAGNPLNNFVTDFRTGTNTLAGKKSSMDRGLEQKTNRKFYSVMTNVSNRVSANMVAGSVSSALTNFIPIIQSWGEVSPVSSLRAMADTIRSTFRDDGTIDKSDFLTNRLKKSENLYKTWWDKAGEKVSFLMESVDSFATQTVWRSKYLENISNGMSESEAIKNADQFAESVIAGRSRGNMPTIFDSKSPVAKLFTAFQLEVNNQYGYMFKDMPQDMKNESALKLAKGYATMFMGAYAYNALYSSLVGRDAAFDPIGIIEDLLRDMGLFDDDEEEEPVDTVMNFAENVLQEVPFVGGLLGGGRVPISAAMPYSGEYEGVEAFLNDISNKDFEAIGKELLNPVYYLAMPLGGGQLKKSIEGLSMFSDDHPISGSYTDSGKLRFPVEDTFGNRLQAGIFGQYASKNARDYFDNGRSPLAKNQIEEFMSSGMKIQDYWDYREGLSGLSKLSEKADYIDSLDLTTEQKNLFINNIADRKEDIDMSDYGDYDDFEEFDFATKNPEKYDFLTNIDVSYKDYASADDDTKDAYDWAFKNPEKLTLSKAVAGDVVTYRKYTGDLYDIKADKDSSGKSITGSRKEKVIDYINNMDLDYGQKIILFKSEYNADDTYNYEILDYLNGRDDLTFDDRVTILKELGFNVDSKGNVTW